MSMTRFIRIIPENGSLVVSAQDNTSLKFIGASCPCSAFPDSKELTSFNLNPQEGKTTVFAFRIYYNPPGRHNPIQSHGLLLKIDWNGDRLECNPDRPFVPPIGKSAHCDKDGNLYLNCAVKGGELQCFAASMDYCRERIAKENWRIVDGNLLCRFLAGDAELDELNKEAGPSMTQVLEGKVAELSQELTAAKQELAEQRRLHSEAGLQAIEQSRQLAGAKGELAAARQQLDSQRDILEFLSRHAAKIGQLVSEPRRLFDPQTWFGSRLKLIAESVLNMNTLNPPDTAVNGKPAKH